MYPHERSLVNEMKGRPFALIGVNSDDNLEEIKGIVKKEKINWRSFQNEPKGATSSISQAWAVRGWPTLVVLDREVWSDRNFCEIDARSYEIAQIAPDCTDCPGLQPKSKHT